MDDVRELELLVNSRYPIIVVTSQEEERVEATLARVSERLALPFHIWSVTEGLHPAGRDREIQDTKDRLRALSVVETMNGDGIFLFKGLHRYLEEPAVIRKLQDISRETAVRRALVLTAPEVSLPPELEKRAARMPLKLPDERELARVVRAVVHELNERRGIRVELTRTELARLIDTLGGLTLFEAERALTRAILEDDALTGADIGRIVDIKRQALQQGGALDYYPPPAPGEGPRVGGLSELKAWLGKRRRAFTSAAREFGVSPPRGLILLGVQGCGKSLAARAVAAGWGLPLLEMQAGRLYDKYVGESEKNLERALQVAERMAPCVLMIDEIEKALSTSAGEDADAGLSRRLLGRLLGWLQDREAPVFVIATCNSVDRLPPELMRKGRFDEIFFLDLPGNEARREIFSIHLTTRGRDPAAFDLDTLATAADGFSGAEIEQAVVSALYTAFSAGRPLDTKLILEEMKNTRPLSATRREEIVALRVWARGRAVMAG